MPAITDLSELLKHMKPLLNTGEYVFCSIASRAQLGAVEPLGSFRESEGLTVIVEREQAQALGLNFDYVAAWLTLEVHSALAAVGLTAAVAKALADAGISCNVIAGFYHDHLFVDHAQGARAQQVLQQLSEGQ
ncbi:MULTISPECIES: ACT domain-containing protein [Pseudomonas]|uniref:ACT domain-containing protein n=1 Tax=Pseudomonas TaxID=286 RepID=UPI0008544D38|nr:MULTISPECIES: ACT domain-containing protein [Pseudomonas]OEO27691.1 acetyltransferase [Pseudomonas sp. J237]SFU01232.1 hypothetical protein SAMN05216264_108130 [Pseudomonas marincola]